MSIQIVVAPFDSGHRGLRLGAGPEAMLRLGLESVLRDAGMETDTERVDVEPEFATEVATSLLVAAHVGSHVFHAVRAGRRPLVLSGNCGAALGGVDGLQSAGDRDGPIGVVWFDAHGDFNTPETSTSGFLDGMSLAMLTGRCWRPAVEEAIWRFRPVPEERVVLVGARDLDGAEAEALRTSRVRQAPGGDGAATLRELQPALQRIAYEDRHECRRVYVHLDCDVLDTSVGRANRFACPGGLTAEQLAEAMRMVRGRFEVAGMGVSAYDPAFDTDGAVYRAVANAVRTLLAP